MIRILLIMCLALPMLAVAKSESGELAYVMSQYGSRMKPGDEVLTTSIDRIIYYNKPCKIQVFGAENMRHYVEYPSYTTARIEGCAAFTAAGRIKTLVIRGDREDWKVWPKSVFFRGTVNAIGTAEYIEPLN